jgi:hypothetical protein
MANQNDRDEARLKRTVGGGLRREETRILRSPEHMDAVRQQNSEVAKMVADRKSRMQATHDLAKSMGGTYYPNAKPPGYK